jgi:hypothetical protein
MAQTGRAVAGSSGRAALVVALAAGGTQVPAVDAVFLF